MPFTIVSDNNLILSLFNARIWIDYNSDGDFTDAGELAFSGPGNGSLTGSINIPSTASPGTKNLRVIIQRFGQPNPCGNYFLGESENYSISINAVCYPHSIDISSLAPGNYLLKIDNGIDSVSRMFVVQD